MSCLIFILGCHLINLVRTCVDPEGGGGTRGLSLNIVFTIANSVDPDEMLHDAAFHLGLPCLQKYPFRGFQYTKG